MSADALQAARSQCTSASGRRLASELIAAWPSATPFDARSILVQLPHLGDNRSAVLDLAYEEFCRRIQNGESVAADEFASRFPEVERSLLHQIQVHRYLEEHSEIVASLAADQWPRPGDAFLGFQLAEEVGRGAFSRVYLAADQNLGNRAVVVKVCRRGGEEAQVLGKLEHPGIVPVHSARHDQRTGLWAICMPYLGRATLFSVLDRLCSTNERPRNASVLLDAVTRTDGRRTDRRGGVPRLLRKGSFVDGVLLVGLQLAEGLAFAHAQGICHGDIKPSNALLTSAGQAMLLDFNLSFGSDAADSGPVGGTLPYMAPEQLRAVLDGRTASSELLDARTDIFSLGTMLYELLTGTLPFGPIPLDQSTRELAFEMLERQKIGPLPLRTRMPSVDRRAAQLVEKCLAFAPVDRPQSAAELVRQLKYSLSGRQRMRRWARNRPTAAGTSLFTVAAAAATVAYVLSAVPADALHNDPQQIARPEGNPQRSTAAGLQALRAGQLQEAVRHFEQALQRNPELLDARFWRGRARLLTGDRSLAREDFAAVLERTQDPRVAACLAYAYALDRFTPEAVQLSRIAIDGGFAPPAVWNNLGRSQFLLSELGEAEKSLMTAAGFSPPPPATLHNLACLHLQRAMAAESEARTSSARRALEFAEQAFGSDGQSPEIFHTKAWASAFLARELANSDPDESSACLRLALHSAQLAVQLGLPPKQLAVVWSTLPDSEEAQKLRELLATVPSPVKEVGTTLLLDPLPADDLDFIPGAPVVRSVARQP